MKTLNNEHLFYAFEPDLEPAMHVQQQEHFALETCDCFENQLKSDADTMADLDWNRTNPATGPVYIDGVKAGDIVRVDILKLEMMGNSVMVTVPGVGAVRGVSNTETRIMDNSNGVLSVATSKGNLELPLSPMIGVIGVVPAEGKISNGVPGRHGGNMDCSIIGENCSVYFRAEVDGGLFGCGDAHSLMGDGEVAVCGAETPARVELSAQTVALQTLPTPFVETPTVYATIASDKNLVEAYQQAIDNMFFFLHEITGLGEGEAARLMSLVGNLRFCQVVDPEYTVRFEFPKSVLLKLGFEGIA